MRVVHFCIILLVIISNTQSYHFDDNNRLRDFWENPLLGGLINNYNIDDLRLGNYEDDSFHLGAGFQNRNEFDGELLEQLEHNPFSLDEFGFKNIFEKLGRDSFSLEGFRSINDVLKKNSKKIKFKASNTDCSNSNDEIFVCTKEGKFKNYQDNSCSSYFLCSLLNNGTYIKTRFICPKNTFFDPKLHICSETFLCPCTSTVSTSTITTSATNCFYSVEDSFFCEKKGRFLNYNDISCSSYFLCSLLNNGTFLRTKYSCPLSSFFDPGAQKCSSLYNCPCTATSTTSTPEITTVKTTTEGSTAASCLNSATEDFSCTEKGRFANYNDYSCSSYFLCSLLNNGTFLRTKYSCPLSSFFDPGAQKCSSLYNCPCTATSTTSTPEITTVKTITEGSTAASCLNSATEDFSCTEKGRFANYNDYSCSSYFLCSLLNNGTFLRTKYSCPLSSFFDPGAQKCSSLYNCPCTATSTTSIPEITTVKTTTEGSTAASCLNSATEDFSCTEKGRFANYNDYSCSSYFLCSLLNNGTFLRTKYSCPLSSFFDPGAQKCSSLYNCPCTATSTTSTPEITTVKTTTEGFTAASCIYTVTDDFSCTEKGRFANYNDYSCSSYFLCSLLNNGTFLRTKYSCPLSSFFDPGAQKCSSLYNCPCTATSTTSTPEITTVKTTTEGSTAASCLYSATEDFSCTEKGRFANYNDYSCSSYFLCSLLNNGTFLRTKYSCPLSSFFDPGAQKCSSLYNCPCTATSTTSTPEITTVKTTTEGFTAASCIYTVTDDFSCTEKGRFANYNDYSCSSYFLCSLLNNGTFLRTKYACPLSSFFDPGAQKCSSLYNCPCTATSTTSTPEITTVKTTTEGFTAASCIYTVTDDFSCTEKGRFANYNDYSCSSYFLCSLLNNGTFLRTKYSCPLSSFFDPGAQKCSSLYNCPCTATSTTSTPEITTVKTTTEGFTAASCIYTVTDDFSCTEKGRFANYNDYSCSSYFLCSLLNNGTFLRTKYACPLSSFFDPGAQKCSSLYNCPCTATSTTSTPEITTVKTTTEGFTAASCIYTVTDDFSCTEKGRFANYNDYSCSSYFLCSLLNNGTFLRTKYSCPLSSFFDPGAQKCSSLYNCPCTATSTTSTPEITTVKTTTEGFTAASCIYTVTDDFSCTEKGRFANYNDYSCSSYFLCSLLNNGTFLRTKYACPLSSFFDPGAQKCSSLYNCPCTATSTTSALEITTAEPTTGGSTATSCIYSATDNFSCTEKGRFPNYNDINCRSYFLCSLLNNRTFLRTNYDCPNNSFFDPSLQECSALFICPCTTTTSITTAITTSEATTEPQCVYSPTSNFICTKIGRFPNNNDLNCRSYFLCSLLNNGSFIQTMYFCPTTSTFNPSIHECSRDYKCPCTISSATDYPTTLSSLTTTQGATEIPPTTIDQCFFSSIDNFVCTERGRFINYKDITCSSYFLCSLLRNGSYIRTLYYCPQGSYFDLTIQKCSATYKCPCSTTTTTTNATQTTPEITTHSDQCFYSAEDNFICTERGRFINYNDITCSTYFLCSLLRNGSLIRTQYSCPLNSYFDQKIQKCSTHYLCPCSTTPNTTPLTNLPSTSISATEETTIEDQCFYSKVDNFICTERGRFINYNDLTCTSYYLCSLLRNGSYIRTLYYCPQGSYFDLTIHKCSGTYKCPCLAISTTPQPTNLPSQTTSATQTTSEITTDNDQCFYSAEDNFVCTERGRFNNSNDITCSTYFLCSLLGNGSLIRTQYACPRNSYFDQKIQKCSTHFVCPCTTTPRTTATNLPSTTIITTEVTTVDDQCLYTKDDNFICTERGRFINYNDITCSSYFLCSLLRNGTFIQTLYKCPTNSHFDPTLQKCSVHFICPCLTTTSTSPASSTLLPSSSTPTESSTQVTTQSQCLYTNTSDDNFICTERGRFPNYNDISCTSYFLCSRLRNGTLIRTLYNCPKTSAFDPKIHICSDTYKCPCE